MKRKWIKRTAIVLISLILMATIVFTGPWIISNLRGKGNFPKLQGEYSVGYQRIYIKDTGVKELLSEETNERELMVSVYYPSDEIKMKSMEYLSEVELKNYLPLPFAQFITRPFQPNLIKDAKPKEGQYPLLIFSPGLTGNTVLYTSLLEQIASKGFIVIGVDHPYTAAVVEFPNGRIARTVNTDKLWDLGTEGDSYRKHLSEIWVSDHSIVLDALDKDGELGIFGPLVDMKQIGVFGHSFGGQASIETLATDERFSSAMNIDGSIFNDMNHSKPTAIVLSDYLKVYENKYKENAEIEPFSEWFKKYNMLPEKLMESEHQPDVYTYKDIYHMGFITDMLVFKEFLPFIINDKMLGYHKADEMVYSLTELVVTWFNNVGYNTENRDKVDNVIDKYDFIYRGTKSNAIQ